MIDDSPADEIIELSSHRWILLSFAREWPRYVVDWSVRQRHGDTDYPVVRGRVVQEPDRNRSTDDLWSDARDRAVEEAQAALESRAASPQAGKKGLLSRLFGGGK